jgi:hypothetical protein
MRSMVRVDAFRLVRWLVAALTVAVLCVPAVALAGEAEDRELALKLGREAVELYQQQRDQEALDRFMRAESLVHSPVFVLYIARIERRRGHWVRALEHYERLHAETLPADAPETWREAQSEAQQEEQALAAEVPTFKVVTSAPAASVTVWVDGKVVQRWQESTRIDPGKHQIVAQYKERSESKRIELQAGDRDVEVSIEFPPEGVPGGLGQPRPVPAPSHARQEDRDEGLTPSNQRIAGYVLLGIGGAAALSFAGVSVALLAKESDMVDHCLERVCPGALDDEVAEHDRLRYATIGLAIGAAAVLITGWIVTGTAPRYAAGRDAASLTWRFR